MHRYSHATLDPLPLDYLNVEIPDGGTSGETVDTAVQELEGVSRSRYNTSGNPIRLDGQGKIPAGARPDDLSPYPTLLGNPFPGAGQITTYEITNYSEFNSYDLAISEGVVTRTGNIISVTTPNDLGPITLLVNGRVIELMVSPPGPVRPGLIVSDESDGLTHARINMAGNAFQGTVVGLTHQATDWELSLTADFGSIVASSYNDAINKTYFSAAQMARNTTFYGRVRYQSDNGAWSDWSVVQTLTTKIDYVLNKISAELRHPIPSSVDSYFGFSCDLTANGDRIIIGAFNDKGPSNDQKGCAYIYRRDGVGWVLEKTITPNSPLTGQVPDYARAVAINDDGSLAFVSSTTPTGDGQGNGAVGIIDVFQRTGTDWTFLFRISDPMPTWGQNVDGSFQNDFGHRIFISSDGQRVCTSAYVWDGDVIDQGQVLVFNRVGNAWVHEGTMRKPLPEENEQFGLVFMMSEDGSFVYASANPSGGGYNQVAAKMRRFQRTGTTWAAGVPVSVGTANITENETYALHNNPNAWGATSQVGEVLVYRKVAGNWTYSQQIRSPRADHLVGFGSIMTISSDSKSFLTMGYSRNPQDLKTDIVFYSYKLEGTQWVLKESFLIPRLPNTDLPFNFARDPKISTQGNTAVVGFKSVNDTLSRAFVLST